MAFADAGLISQLGHPPPEREQFWQRNLAISDKVLAEDWVLGEGIQRSLEGGAIEQVLYGSNQWALSAFNQAIDRVLAT